MGSDWRRQSMLPGRYWAQHPNHCFVFCLAHQSVSSSNIRATFSHPHPWCPAEILAHHKNSICIYWIREESWILDLKRQRIPYSIWREEVPKFPGTQTPGKCMDCMFSSFQSLAATWPPICHFCTCLALHHASCPSQWEGPRSCQRWLMTRKHPFLPYLLAVGSLLLSGSRVLCHSPQGGRRPHQTGKGPWSSPLPSSRLWGNTPWLVHSLPAQPGAGRLEKRERRENAINTVAVGSECLSLVLSPHPEKV